MTPQVPSDRRNRIGRQKPSQVRGTHTRENEAPDEGGSSQGRGTKLSNESQTEGRELDAEGHLRNFVEATSERESSELQKTGPEQKLKTEREPSRRVRVPW